MSQDYNYQVIVGYDREHCNQPLDEFGHHLVKEDHREVSVEQARMRLCHPEKIDGIKKVRMAREMTNPYGVLEFSIGSGDDFWCFDYAFLEDGHVIIHATVNSETGSFIDGIEYSVVSKEEAPSVALRLCFEAMEWCSNNEVKIDKSGWNQDPYYFYRCVFISCNPDTPHKFSQREMRFGGKRINKYCQLEYLSV